MSRFGVPVFPSSRDTPSQGYSGHIQEHVPDELPLPPYSTNDRGIYRPTHDNRSSYNNRSYYDVDNSVQRQSANQQSSKLGNYQSNQQTPSNVHNHVPPPTYHSPKNFNSQRIRPEAVNEIRNHRISQAASTLQSPTKDSGKQRMNYGAADNNLHSPTKYSNQNVNHGSTLQSTVGLGNQRIYQSDSAGNPQNERIDYGPTNYYQSKNKSNQQSPTQSGRVNYLDEPNNTLVGNSRISHAMSGNAYAPADVGNHGISHAVAGNPQSLADVGNHRISHAKAANVQSPAYASNHGISQAMADIAHSPNEVSNHRLSHMMAANPQSLSDVGNHRINHTIAANPHSLSDVGNHRISNAPMYASNHGIRDTMPGNDHSPNEVGNHRISHTIGASDHSPNEVGNRKIGHTPAIRHQSSKKFGSQKKINGYADNLQSPGEVDKHVKNQAAIATHIPEQVAKNMDGDVTHDTKPKTPPQDTHPFRLHRSLPLNDTESTHLFTFLLNLNNIDGLRETPVRSSVASYQGHKWYLTTGVYSNDNGVEFLGVFLYWLTTQNHNVGGNEVEIKCRTDYRIIVRNVINPAESKISEGAQMEYSPSMTTGWGKRELITLHELCSRGNGFINEPGSLVIVELAMKSCTTTFEHRIDVSHLGTQTFQDQSQYPAHFTPNFALGAYEFYLSVYPRGDRDKARNCVSMYLHRYSSSSDLLGCRVRFRFFVGKRVSPSSGASFDYVFKENKGYGKYKAFEPLTNTDFMNRSSILTIGVDIVSITPLAQVEVPLVTRGYYHTDNFVFDEVVFPDHLFNYWKLSVDNSNAMLQFKFDTEDKEMLQTTDKSCTKFLQWRAFVISRKDKKKSKAVLACPLTSFFSRHLFDTEITMSTQIPLQTAKELNGDYCTKQEPSLLIRIEILDLQDLPEAVHEQPILHFERIQLYHMRDGFRRCMKVQNRLEAQIEELKKKMNELLQERRVGKEEAFQHLQAILQMHENVLNATSPTALPHSLEVPSEASEPLSDSIDGNLNNMSWLPPPFVSSQHVPETIEADPHAGIMQTDL
ncbi:uncharacterized protein [Antedon mediterranea]|uniref:uncharacterized protein n=1 Tax=Antedon mediterranea TaxID=105859 RepID=UPI003AF9E34F